MEPWDTVSTLSLKFYVCSTINVNVVPVQTGETWWKSIDQSEDFGHSAQVTSIVLAFRISLVVLHVEKLYATPGTKAIR
jgi:hypothetical protein